MFKKILVANRGEIALRILRTVKEMGLGAVAVYEKPDSDAYYIRSADEAILIIDNVRGAWKVAPELEGVFGGEDGGARDVFA